MKQRTPSRLSLSVLCALLMQTTLTLRGNAAENSQKELAANEKTVAKSVPFLNSPANQIEVGIASVIQLTVREFVVVVTAKDQKPMALNASLQVGTYIPPEDLGRPAIVRATVKLSESGERTLQLISVDANVHEEERAALFELRKLGVEIKRNQQRRINRVSLGGPQRPDGTRGPLTQNEMQHLKPLTDLESLMLGDVTDEGLMQLSSLTKLKFIQMGSERLTSAGLKGLTGSKDSIEVLNLRLPNLTNDGLAHFSDFTKLWCLRLNGSKISSDGLAHLKNLKTLGILEVNDTQVGDDGLKHLSELSQLEYLFLAGTPITDDALARIPDLKKLWALKLDRTAISDTGLENFREFESLKGVQFLYLEDTKVTDAGLAHLVDMKQLEGLHLDKNKITDTGLKHLQPHSHLKWVNVRGGNVSEAAVKKLSEGKPNGFYVGRDRR